MSLHETATQPHGPLILQPRWHTLVRLVLALIAALAGLQCSGLLIGWLREAVLELAPGPTGLFDLLSALLSVASAGGAYVLYVRIVERRPVSELDLGGAGRELGLGLLLGTLLIALCVSVLWALGMYRVIGTTISAMLFSTLAAAIYAGFVEELLVRGIVFRLVEQMLGTWLALLLSAILFGAMHICNPGATAWSSTAIALEAGVLLGAAFVLTHRLWLAVGLHAAWNFVQGGVFGLEVSGLSSVGLLRSELVGPPALTGGDFGVEASPLAVVVCLLAAGVLLRQAWRHGRMVAPPWRGS